MASKKTNLGLDRTTSWTAEKINETEMPEVQWLVKDILPQGFFFLAGRPKIGKSFMTVQLCASITTGQQFLGHDVNQGRVLYISLEDNARRIKKRLRNMGAVDLKGLDQFEIEERWEKLNKGGLEKLLKRLQSKKYALCIIDTYAKSMLMRDNNDAVEATKYLTPLYEMTRGGEFSFGFVDHHRKNNQYSGDVIDDLAGSGAKGGVADTVWGLIRERGKQAAKLQIASRDTEVDLIDLVFDKERTMWMEQSQDIIQPGTVQAKIITHMGSNGKAAYITDVARKLGYDQSVISREMQELVHKGFVTRGVKEGKFIPYMLVNSKEDNRRKN